MKNPLKIEKKNLILSACLYASYSNSRVGIVTGYNVSYCAIATDNAEGDCVGPEMHQTTGPDKEHLWITGLKPWTYYKVRNCYSNQPREM